MTKHDVFGISTSIRQLLVVCSDFVSVQKLKTRQHELKISFHQMGIFFRGGVMNFFRVTLKAFIRTRMTVWTIQFETFGTIRPQKIIFWDYIFENFCLKMSKNTFIGLFWLRKGTYYLFVVRNEEFRCLRSEYMTIIIS